MLRRIAERLTGRLVLRRHLPQHFGGGPILVSAAGGLKYLRRPLGAVDPMLLRIAERFVRVNGCVWDIGANVGLFTFAAAARAGRGGRVVAVEADDSCAALLRRTARLGVDRAGVTVISAAVAERCGIREFQIAARARASNALAGYGHSQMGGVARGRPIVLCEVAEGNVAEVTDFFHSRGYELFDADSCETCKVARATMNTLCIPR